MNAVLTLRFVPSLFTPSMINSPVLSSPLGAPTFTSRQTKYQHMLGNIDVPPSLINHMWRSRTPSRGGASINTDAGKAQDLELGGQRESGRTC